MKEDIKKLLKKNWGKLIGIILIVPFLILFYSEASILLGSVLNILKIYLGDTLYIFILMFFSLSFLGFFLYLLKNFFPALNWWFLSTLLFMILIFLFGIYATHEIVGKTEFPTLVLRDLKDNLNIVGNISCYGSASYRVLIAGDDISCIIGEPELSNFSSYVSFTLEDESIFDLNYTYDRVQFTAPENATRIVFYIEGNDLQNDFRQLTVSYNYNFFTKEQSKKLDEKFLSYLYILLTVIILAIPNLMKNLRDLKK